jgi:hypothetical protein
MEIDALEKCEGPRTNLVCDGFKNCLMVFRIITGVVAVVVVGVVARVVAGGDEIY